MENDLNPGSKEAVKAGCSCPILDNRHGAGYMGQKDLYIMTEDCKIHGIKTLDKGEK